MEKLHRLGLFLGFLAATQAQAASYIFTTIDVPGAVTTNPVSINYAGQIVGAFKTLADFQGNNSSHGFILSGGSFTTFDVPRGAILFRYADTHN